MYVFIISFRFEVEILSPSNPLRGRIVTGQFLDREEVQTYLLLLTAMDNSSVPLTSSVPVTITVTDVNDNQPVFNMLVLSFNVPEDARLNMVITEITVSGFPWSYLSLFLCQV